MQQPTVADILQRSQTALQNQRPAEAETLLRALLKQQARLPDAWYLFGLALSLQNRQGEAISALRQALKLNPQAASYQASLGAALLNDNQPQAAYQCLLPLLEQAEPPSGVRFNFALSLMDLRRPQQAMEQLREVLTQQPDFAPAHYWLGQAHFELGEMAAASVSLREALRLNPAHPKAYSRLLLALQCLADNTAEYSFHYARAFNQHCAAPLAEPGFDFSGRNRDPQRRLRIGYVSSDLRAHSVAYFIHAALSHHDSKEVEVFCYHNHRDEDALSAHFRGHADHWLNCSAMSDAELAARIDADRIDLLIDLNGHTVGNRLLCFARRPAPVQISYLGYPGTTGLDTMDYRLTDAVADPLGSAEAYSSETLVRLPGSYFCYVPPAVAWQLPVQNAPCLETDFICFGSFNNYAKISDETLGLWAEILHLLPESKFLIKARAMDDDKQREAYLQRFGKLGIPEERLLIEGYAADMETHLQQYHRLDIALDCWPYNGATTTCEALWMGVPVISLCGEQHPGRMARSILHAAGLPELACETGPGFIETALELAVHRERLQTIRQELRSRLEASPLLDAASFTRQLEATYRSLWEHWALEE